MSLIDDFIENSDDALQSYTGNNNSFLDTAGFEQSDPVMVNIFVYNVYTFMEICTYSFHKFV
jgi:hypothetical protein